MKIFTCQNNCCLLKHKPYISYQKHFGKNAKKAGVFIYDPLQKKILLVQSRGQFWGMPKGSLNISESEIDCAIRETKEETGLVISPSKLGRSIKVKNKATYFYYEHNICDIDIQDHIMNNDVNALGWIKPECLRYFVDNKQIILNKHCIILLKKILNEDFS
jgi:8-oxo-dGTP pyrophosphatase MutT (NUDIX family)